MHKIDEILGHDKIIENIITALKDNREIVLTGPSGTGKSYIAGRVKTLWKNKKLRKIAIYLNHDTTYTQRSYFPFIEWIAREKIYKIPNFSTKKGFAELSKGIPIAGDLISYLIEILINKNINSQKLISENINSKELEILNYFNSIFRNADLLIIVDNAQKWDNECLKLIEKMISGKFDEYFLFLNRIKILYLINPDELNNENIFLHRFLDGNRLYSIPLKKITKDYFGKIVNLFGANYQSSREMDELLYTLTDGHLEIIKKLAQIIPSNYSIQTDFISDLKPLNESLKQTDFLEKILILRLQELGASGTQIIKLLEYASIIGLHFTNNELACLTKVNETKLLQIIQQASDATFLEINNESSAFTNEIIRQFFLCRLGNKKFQYYKRFAECLQVLRPTDYLHRANLLFEAGETKVAISLYLIGYYKCLRNGFAISQLVEARIDLLTKEFEYINYHQLMIDSYNLFFKSDYIEAVKRLKQIEDSYPEILIAEKYYLLSLNLSKTLNSQDLLLAKNCLLNWDHLMNKESELWARILITLMSRCAHLNQYTEAATIERKLMIFLTNRISFDPSAEYNINVIRRKASILHIAEIACKRTLECLKYFGSIDPGGIYRSPIQYYMALANHSGNLIVMGDFKEANNFASMAISLPKNYPEINFPRLEIPINNYIISGYLSGKLLSSECVRIFHSLQGTITTSKFKILLENNYIIMIALNGDINEAFKLSNDLSKILLNSTRKDSYYEYFVDINRAVFNFLLLRKAKAINILKNVSSNIPSIPDKDFIERRNELILEAFKKTSINNPLLWDDYLLKMHPQEIGPSWEFFGRGFLFSDLQFWSDS